MIKIPNNLGNEGTDFNIKKFINEKLTDNIIHNRERLKS